MTPEPRGGQAWIEALGLRPHPEGGYYQRRWRTAETVVTAGGERPLASSIHYLLTADSPIGRFHCNASDITHVWIAGGPIVYGLISPAGEWQTWLLGPGQRVGFTCPGGWWKSSHLPAGSEYGLIREIVTPGFDYADHRFADEALFAGLFPQHRARWAGYVLADAAERGGPREGA
ncbi:MAG: cupin domain-containing protein [Myxococcales bacterium]|nr:cupin domain-containing protein [Myxococcales bacterium]